MNTSRLVPFAALLATLAGPPAAAQSEPLRIGQSISLTGGTADHGNAVLAGIKAALAKANAEGGVRGRRIELKTLDDGSDSTKSAANAKALAQDPGVVALFGGVEGGPCVAQMKVAIETGVPLVACMAGSPELRDPGHRLVFPVRAGHYDEFARLIEQSLRYGMGRIAFVHSDSDTGRKHLANVRKLLAAQGKELTLALAVPSKPDIKAMAKQLADARIEAVFNHGSYGTYAQLLRETRAMGATTTFMAVNSGAQQMVKLLGPDAKGLIFTQVVPFPWGMERAVVREYQVAIRKLDPQAQYSFSSLEGYISARVLVEALRRAKSPTREGVVQALEGLAPLDVGGFAVAYGRDSREGSTFVDTVIATSKGDFRH